MPAAIVCDALTRDFGDVRAVDRLSVAVPEGSIFAFLGPNGAGKTTTIHLLLGIIEPTSGSARVLGLDPARDGEAVRRQSGALLEHAGLYERMSAADNLRFHAEIARLGSDEADARIAELLTRFGLYDRRGDAVATWSRGMKQKLAIARVLLHRPSLVFLDEPTAGLDPESTVALRRDITSLETTVFLTTHNLTDVEKMATHVAVIKEGRLLDFGTPAELRARAVRTHVTIRMQDREPLALDLAPGESVASVVTRLVHEGAQIEEVRREEPSIEDVFLQLVKRESGGQAILPVLSADEAKDEQAGLPVLHRRQPVFRDIATVVRKEWRELMAGSRRVNVIAGVAFLAIVAGLAAVIDAQIVAGPALTLVSFIAFIALIASVPDSFAGERERHTLETLLATGLPDEALLLGKILSSVFYGWLASLVLVAVLLLGTNVTHFPAFPPPSTLLTIVVLTPLMLTALATAGVLLSLRAPTVKEAQMRLSALFFGLLIPLVAVRPFLPRHVVLAAAQQLKSEPGRLVAVAAQIVFFLVLDVVLLAFAFVRFRRSRMIQAP